MAPTFHLERVRHYVLPAVAALVGLGVAIGIATVPSDVLNAAVDRAGFASILPAAASPIGTTGRTILALLAGAAIAACGLLPQAKAWVLDRMDTFARAPRTRVGSGGEREEAPVVRRADAHPDAPPRRPIRAASDLGDPLPIFGEEDQRSAPLTPPAEQSLPADLDRPLAEFDPAAVPLHPMAPPEPIAPLVRRAEPVQRADVPAPRFVSQASEQDDASERVGQENERDFITAAEARAWSKRHEQPVCAVPPAFGKSETPTDVDRTPSSQRDTQEEQAPTSPVVTESAAPPTERVSPRLVVPGAATATGPQAHEDDSIAGLLARLERGAAQRRTAATPVVLPAPAPPPAEPQEPAPASLDDTLQRLRRLAAS